MFNAFFFSVKCFFSCLFRFVPFRKKPIAISNSLMTHFIKGEKGLLEKSDYEIRTVHSMVFLLIVIFRGVGGGVGGEPLLDSNN